MNLPAADTDGPDFAFVDAGADGYAIADGDDWSLPEWVRPASNSGYFSEDASVKDRVLVRSVDFTWRQLQPTKGGALDTTATGSAQSMDFDSYDDQLKDDGAFWMRIFASGVDWAPEWVQKECGVAAYGPDYDRQKHLPIWDECVWGHLMDTYRTVFVDKGLAADPRLKFVYVPGAFTWAEYDYDIINAAVESGDLDFATYKKWYDHAWTDLVELFGDNANKLVFTGEDYPFAAFGEQDDLLSLQAVDAGMGVRTGITEIFNFHLSEAPSYGSSIQPNGHMVVDESLPVHDGTRVVATENECYNDCGYETDDPYYAVRQSNLKALQLRMNWIYIVPDPSYVAEFPEHWDWVRLSMGQKAETSPDAWAALRDAEDTYWNDEVGRFSDPESWKTRPYVRNLERWLVQVDEPGSVAHRTETDVHSEVFESENGTAYEGLSTAVAEGDTGFAFEIDERFADAAASAPLVAKITYLDSGAGGFTVDTDAGSSVVVPRGATGAWRTATVALPAGATSTLRVSLVDGADDLVVRFVRLVRAAQ
ncbi:MAG: hypothetical protein ACOH1T_10385 [Microbacteriaceae bacterium]